MLIRNEVLWQLRLGPLWVTRVYPLVRRFGNGTRHKPGSLTVFFGKRALVQKQL